MRLIDADALLRVTPFTKRGGDLTEYTEGYLDCAADARDAIERAATADVAPKSEVAKEIFEEIETILAKNLAMGSSGGPALYYKVNEIDDLLAELKAKYSEEQK